MAATKGEHTIVEACGQEVRVSNPGKVFFPERGITKLDLVNYYLECAQAVVLHLRERPTVMKRWVNGVEGEPFFQKRVPDSAPEWLQTATVTFPSGRHARELVPNDAAHLVWGVNLGVIDWNPWPVRRVDLDHPDELRVDLDPCPDVPFAEVREVALCVREVLDEHRLVGFPKTSGSRGIHVNVRIERRWSFDEVRRAALALAREVERRAPQIATSKWWKEERHGVFIDYNQNAKDRTVASAYSVRPVPEARVSAPVTWAELPECELGDFTIATVPGRFARIGDPAAGIDQAVGSLEQLLELSARQAKAGQGDAPWPPNYAKAPGEPPRVAPSRARRPANGDGEAVTVAPRSRKISPTGRRTSVKPLIEIARAATKEAALAGFERWKSRHAGVVAHLEPSDLLVDSMRGRFTLWYRIRVNLEHIPAAERPAQEPLDADYDPWAAR